MVSVEVLYLDGPCEVLNPAFKISAQLWEVLGRAYALIPARRVARETWVEFRVATIYEQSSRDFLLFADRVVQRARTRWVENKGSFLFSFKWNRLYLPVPFPTVWWLNNLLKKEVRTLLIKIVFTDFIYFTHQHNTQSCIIHVRNDVKFVTTSNTNKVAGWKL